MSEDFFIKALVRMEAYCSRSEKCEYDVRQKLNQINIDLTTQNRIVDSLRNDSFICDERFANAFCLDKFRFNHWGKIRIRIELKKRNLSDALIEKAITIISDEDYQKKIKYLIENKKIKAANNYEYSQKMLRYMYGKGFEPELVSEFLEY
jgi:regulatory protein